MFGAPEQTAQADVTLDENRMSEDIRGLAVTCIISIKGPVTTMIYPKTMARTQSEDELAERHCIRAFVDLQTDSAQFMCGAQLFAFGERERERDKISLSLCEGETEEVRE